MARSRSHERHRSSVDSREADRHRSSDARNKSTDHRTNNNERDRRNKERGREDRGRHDRQDGPRGQDRNERRKSHSRSRERESRDEREPGTAIARDISSSRERSRERERRRRRMQAECIRRAGGYQKLADSEGKEPVRLFWDGFQWVAKTGHSTALQNDPALMNSTRKMRRLYFGNLPLHMGLTETAFQEMVWAEMQKRGFCNNAEKNPVLCVWFAKDKGNYGFVEFDTVEETERALTMDGMACLGVPLKVSRPNDYSTATAGQSNAMALMGQQSAQALQMQNTGGSNGNRPQSGLQQQQPVASVTGRPSRILRILQVILPETIKENSEYSEILEDVKEGFGRHAPIIGGCIISPDTVALTGTRTYNLGDVFLEFNDIPGAEACIAKMAGRKYEGRPLHIARLPEMEFSNNIKNLMIPCDHQQGAE
eukprot:Selendium_serpulae@DN4382_c0_g1_i3.p1